MDRMNALALDVFLAVKREAAMIAAFASVIGSGLVVSIGAWVLLLRERRAGRREGSE
jgi:hypothetical protein